MNKPANFINKSPSLIFSFSNFQIFKFTLAGLIFSACLFSSCQKESFTTSAVLGFSADTLKFDTVFSTLGSTTKFFTIRNNDKKAIRIDEIKLAGGAGSSYRINVDGD